MGIITKLTTVQRIRSALVSLLITSVVFPGIYQPPLDIIWMKLRGISFYNWSTFETIWTILCYIIIEHRLTMVFLNRPAWRFVVKQQSQSVKATQSKPKGMRRPSRRIGEFLIYITPLLAMDLTMIKKFAGVPLADMLESGNYDIAAQIAANSTEIFGPHRQTFLVPMLHNFSSSSPLQVFRALPKEAPSSRRVTMELITSFVIYDMMFFLFHLSLHTVRPLRLWHAPHHSHDVQLNPQITNKLSIFERLGLVMLANFSLNIIGAHVLTRTLFVPLFVWLLVEIHCGMDLPWGYEKVLPSGWGGGARKHMRHHNVGNGGFEPFFCWWDGLWESTMFQMPG